MFGVFRGFYSCLLQSHVAPLAANDRLANFGGRSAFTMQLVDKENLLEAHRSAGAMVVDVTFEQAVVPEAGIAVTVAGLLREDFGNVFCDLICAFGVGCGKLRRIER